MRRIALIAALPGELRSLVGGWETKAQDGVHLWRFAASDQLHLVAACAGMGAAAAARAFAAARRDGPLDLVVSAGWAGALRPDFAVGRVCRLEGVIDAQTGERFPAAGGGPDGWAVTAPKVANREEKWRLAAKFGGSVVEMEAAEVARQARAAGIPFRCLKAVSDGWNDDLPDVGKFMNADGGLRWGGFAAQVLARPWRWPGLMRLGRNSGRAARSLMRELPDFMVKSPEERTDGPAGA